MKNLLKVSLFAMGVVLSSTSFAATGTGEAQAELTNSLSVVNMRNVDFGTIAIDPAAGPQVVSISWYDVLTCPATYVCIGSPLHGYLKIYGAPSTVFYVSVVGQTAILSDGAGHTLIFDPEIDNVGDSYSGVLTDIDYDPPGIKTLRMSGSIQFTGDEPAGVYNTTNSGGSGYQITVNY